MTVSDDLQQSKLQFKDAACSLTDVIVECSHTAMDGRACVHTRSFAAMLLVHLAANGKTVSGLIEMFGSKEI